ncbi:MAG TPA: beta-ketoacyl synthase N-terminal-like domain-containing protein [Steroidobacteraceae bacterium]|nr:beta-ketoacyl synthase N-terminal-like domain-containing protein [Steroidobacteraceae bacterium]
MSAVICASNVLCAGGRGTEQVWATVRSGMACIGNSNVCDQNFDSIHMGLVPEKELEPLPSSLASSALPSGAKRLLRLAGPTLAHLSAAAGTGPLTVFLGLPMPSDSLAAPWMDDFLMCLNQFEGVKIAAAGSRVFPFGRAAALVAMEAALDRLREDPLATVIVGGVDSFLDMRRIADLDAERRILGPRVMDGFIPGEGAAFLALKADEPGTSATPTPALIVGAASSDDAGHRYGSSPNLGVGLADAIEGLRTKLPPDTRPIATTFAGINGESFDSKLWGVARLRHGDLFASNMVLQHPVDCFGDTGAAAGAILAALAGHALSNGERDGSALVWAASDHTTRSCALLSLKEN